jgi:adenylate cyclase
LRSPIHRIISFAEMISESAESSQNQRLLGRVTDAIKCCQFALKAIAGLADVESDYPMAATGLKRDLESTSMRLRAFAEEELEQPDLLSAPLVKADMLKLQEATRMFSRETETTSTERLAAILSSSHGAASPLHPILAQGHAPLAPALRGLILVVDDNEDNRDVLSRRLLRDGQEVMLADGGRQALRMLQRYPFDLILLDIMMPEMDGYQVLEAVKADPQLRYLPIIMITAVDDVESIIRCVEMGADDYLLKPFNRVLLRARIGSLLERKRLRDQELRNTAQLTNMIKEMEVQRERSQTLLLNILPMIVAEELQQKGTVEPMYFEDVSILFADIVGFTLSTEQLPADELVYSLHEYFTAFDHIVERYALEKLKTIGDCYMLAGGVPVRSPSNPVDVVLAALEMIHAVKELSGRGPVSWQVRIGVNTGPVIAGVVGIKKFAFDIWGDAVNYSARMESSGQPGRVNLSGNTFARVKDFFDCEKQEKVRVKDGRDIDTYLVKSIGSAFFCKPAMTPEQAFKQRYRAYFRKELQAFHSSLTETAAESSERF